MAKRILAALFSIAMLAWLTFHAWLIAAHATFVVILAFVIALTARFAIRGRRQPKAA